jgi:hypothetical protein
MSLLNLVQNIQHPHSELTLAVKIWVILSDDIAFYNKKKCNLLVCLIKPVQDLKVYI